MATGYSLLSYGDMVLCKPRMPAFEAAMRRAITPGCTVIEIGTGPGIFALLACKYGAGHVYAIEPDASIEVARQLAIDNGVADRITFIRGLSTKFTPPRKADVIISDIRGALPLFEHHIPTIVDARARLLAPGGTLISRSDTIHAAVVESAEEARRYHAPWAENSFGLDLRAGHRHALGSWGKAWLGPEALLTAPRVFARIDYHSVTEENYRATIEWEVQRAGTAHGLLMWFEADLADGIGYTNAPGAPRLVYEQAFFPLQAPVFVTEGDRVAADIGATLSEGQYVWSWNTRVTLAGAAKPVARFRQSSFQRTIFTPDTLALLDPGYRPPRREAQAVDAFLLERFDGQRDLTTLATELQAAFPARFADAKAARDHAMALAARYQSRPEEKE